MQLKDIMTRDVEVIHPDATLTEAAAKMDSLNVGALPVCDGNQVLGVITDRDITVRSTAVGSNPQAARVRDAMTTDAIYSFEDQNVNEAAKLMDENQIRRLIVLNRAKQLVGIVSLGDTLKQVSEPAEPDR